MKITKTAEWYSRMHWVFFIVGWLCCIIPTLVAGYLKLPKIVVKSSAEETLTGSAIVVLTCASYPLLKGLLKLFKSPSAWLILWILTGITYALFKVPNATIEAMYIIFFVAAIGNSVGALLFGLSKYMLKKCSLCGGR